MRKVLQKLFPVSALFMFLLSGCAANNAVTLMKASQKADPLIPSAVTVEQEFKGRSFYQDNVYVDPQASLHLIEGTSAEYFVNLIRQQVLKAFTAAKLQEGKLPACSVRIIVEEMKLTRGMFILPDPSILRISLEVYNVSDDLLLKGSLETRYMPMIPIILPGIVGALPTSFAGQEWGAVVKMIPAVAVATTKIIQGLQQGQGLEQIKIYPDSLATGGIIIPDAFLKDNPYGLSELTVNDL